MSSALDSILADIVRDRVASSKYKQREKTLFSLIAAALPLIPAGHGIERALSVLCKKKTAHILSHVGQIKGFTASDANFIHSETNWSGAKKWVEWWMQPITLVAATQGLLSNER